MLGLSATPCRFKNNCFDPQSFIRKFIGTSVKDDEFKPFMNLENAIEDGFLCEPSFEKDLLPQKARGQIDDILTKGNSQEMVAMGEYNHATLRDVWGVLSEHKNRVVAEIKKAFQYINKAVIFLPPVESEADDFVEEIKSVTQNVFDFRSRSEEKGDIVFEQFSKTKRGILITIDRFKEGVSVSDIDMLIMLRATLSPRVAMQALGRGLRVFEGKEKCIILDFVKFEERVKEWEYLLDGNLPKKEKTDAVKISREVDEDEYDDYFDNMTAEDAVIYALGKEEILSKTELIEEAQEYTDCQESTLQSKRRELLDRKLMSKDKQDNYYLLSRGKRAYQSLLEYLSGSEEEEYDDYFDNMTAEDAIIYALGREEILSKANLIEEAQRYTDCQESTLQSKRRELMERKRISKNRQDDYYLISKGKKDYQSLLEYLKGNEEDEYDDYFDSMTAENAIVYALGDHEMLTGTDLIEEAQEYTDCQENTLQSKRRELLDRKLIFKDKQDNYYLRSKGKKAYKSLLEELDESESDDSDEQSDIGYYISLKKAWLGFKIAKGKGNKKEMRKYAKIINNIQEQLGEKKTEFKI